MLWEDNYLAHFGIKGQKWGVRRFQNEDGTLTAEGKERYNASSSEKKYAKDYDNKVKNGKFDNDPELKDIYVMEHIEFDNLVKQTKDFDKMSPNKRKEIGDKILSSISTYLKNRDLNNIDEDLERNFGELERWVGLRVSTKSGADTSIGSATEGNRIVREKIAKKASESNDRMNVIKKEINYQDFSYNFITRKRSEEHMKKVRAENQRLSAALHKDKIWLKII